MNPTEEFLLRVARIAMWSMISLFIFLFFILPPLQCKLFYDPFSEGIFTITGDHACVRMFPDVSHDEWYSRAAKRGKGPGKPIDIARAKAKAEARAKAEAEFKIQALRRAGYSTVQAQECEYCSIPLTEWDNEREWMRQWEEEWERNNAHKYATADAQYHKIHND